MFYIKEEINRLKSANEICPLNARGIAKLKEFEYLLSLAESEVKKLNLHAAVVSDERAELCDNPNCEDGIVDRDYYGHPIYCQVCESHINRNL